MPIHSRMVFPSNGPWFAWAASNRGATALTQGEIVCLWAKTDGDTIATTTTMWIRAASSGDGAGTFASQGNTDTTVKVMGVVLNAASVAQGAEALIGWGGVLGTVNTTGTVATNSVLILSGVVGALKASTTFGQFRMLAVAMNTAAGAECRAFVTPWRQ